MHFDRNVHYLVSVLHLKDLLDVLEQSLGTPEMHCSVNMLSLKHLNRGWKHFGCWDLGLQNHGCIHPFVNDCTWETSIILRAVRIVWPVSPRTAEESVPPLVPPRPSLWAGCEGFTTPSFTSCQRHTSHTRVQGDTRGVQKQIDGVTKLPW